MSDIAPGTRRIATHPILSAPERKAVEFSWQGETITALDGECISTALFANGIHVFGHHAKDGSPQGIFCANGCTTLYGASPQADILMIQGDSFKLEIGMSESAKRNRENVLQAN